MSAYSRDIIRILALLAAAQMLAAGLLLLANNPWPWLRMAVGIICVFVSMGALLLFMLKE